MTRKTNNGSFTLRSSATRLSTAFDSVTLYGEDPAAIARRWLDAGARRLHLVDLNGAFAGKPGDEAREGQDQGKACGDQGAECEHQDRHGDGALGRTGVPATQVGHRRHGVFAR